MRRLLFVSLLAALAAVAQLPRPVAISPRRISATEIRKDGGVTHYRGNVAFRTGGLDIHGEELDYLAGEWQFRTRGGARASLARPVAEYVGDPLDVSRFEADGIRRDGETLTLHGNARLRLPNWVVSAEDAVVGSGFWNRLNQGRCRLRCPQVVCYGRLGTHVSHQRFAGSRRGRVERARRPLRCAAGILPVSPRNCREGGAVTGGRNRQRLARLHGLDAPIPAFSAPFPCRDQQGVPMGRGGPPKVMKTRQSGARAFALPPRFCAACCCQPRNAAQKCGGSPKGLAPQTPRLRERSAGVRSYRGPRRPVTCAGSRPRYCAEGVAERSPPG